MAFEETGVRAVVEGVDRYVSDAGKVNRATGTIGEQTERTGRKAKRSAADIRAFGASLQQAGTIAVTAGAAMLAAAAGPAILAASFEAEFTKIEILVGETRENLQAMRDDVLALSRDTAIAPQELAQALFVIESGGLRGEKAMEALDRSARGAALGLGNTSDIARLVTQALLAYEQTGLTAAEATDIIGASARAGNFEVSQLAGTLGKVLPLASQLGVSFADLGAFVATYTRIGGNASDATTALNAVLTALVRGTAQSSEALQSIGLTLDGLRRTAREEGLAEAMLELLAAVDEGGAGAEERLSEIIPSIEALRGVLATAGAQGDAFLQIQNEVADSLGFVDDGMKRLSEDAFFRFKQAMNDAKLAAMEFGTAALPTFSALIAVATDLIAMISRIPSPILSAAGAAALMGGAFLTAVGPLLILAGTAMRFVGMLAVLRTAIITTNLALAATPVGLALIAASLAVGAGAWLIWGDNAERAGGQAEEAVGHVESVLAQLDQMAESATPPIERAVAETEALISALEAYATPAMTAAGTTADLSGVTDEAAEAARRMIDEYGTAPAALEAARGLMDQLIERQRIAADTAADLTGENDQQRDSIDDVAAALRKMIPQQIAAAAAARILAIRQSETIPPFVASVLALGVFARAVGDVKRAVGIQADIAQLTEVILRMGGAWEESADSARGAADATRDPTDPTDRIRDLTERLARDAEAARERMRSEQIRSLDILGNLVVTALRRQAQAELTETVDGLNARMEAAREFERDRLAEIERSRDAAISAIEAERDARLGALAAATAAIEAERDARIGALNEQLRAIDQASRADERADLERQLQIAFDPREAARIRQQIVDLERGIRRGALRDEISAVGDAAAVRTGALRDEIGAVRDAADERIDIECGRAQDAMDIAREERDALITSLRDQADAARSHYAEMTDAWQLESDARRLIVGAELDQIAAMLDQHVGEWRTAGMSMGEALADGIRQGGAGGFVGGALAGVPGTPQAQTAADDRAVEIAGRQAQLGRAVEAGLPSFVLDSMRRELAARGAVPRFILGGRVPGPPGRPVPVMAHGQERIVPFPASMQSAGPSGGSAGSSVVVQFADGMGWLAEFVSVTVDGKAQHAMGAAAFEAGLR